MHVFMYKYYLPFLRFANTNIECYVWQILLKSFIYVCVPSLFWSNEKKNAVITPVEHLTGFRWMLACTNTICRVCRYANRGFLGLFRKTAICACLTCITFIMLTSNLHNPVDHSISFKMNVSMYQDYEYVPMQFC